MAKHTQNAPQDVAEEKYRGPSAVSAAAGEGYIAHFQWAIMGLLGGGGLAFLFKDTSKRIIDACRAFADNAEHPDNKNPLKRVAGSMVDFVFGEGANRWTPIADAVETHADTLGVAMKEKHKDALRGWAKNKEFGFGSAVVEHAFGWIPWLGDKVKTFLHTASPRTLNALSAGGLFAAIGFFIVPMFLAKKGVEKGLEGKRQFERAKEQIIDLRRQNASLSQQLGGDPSLVVSQDDPVVRNLSAADPTDKEGQNHTARMERPQNNQSWGEAIRAQQDAAQIQDTARA